MVSFFQTTSAAEPPVANAGLDCGVDSDRCYVGVESGIMHITFPAFFGHNAVNDTSGGPYSANYEVSDTDTDTGSFTITAVDNVNNSATTSWTITRDITISNLYNPGESESSDSLSG